MRHRDRQAQGMGRRSHAPAQPPLHVVGDRPALVRLVRVQRGQCVGGKWGGRDRLPGDPGGRGNGGIGVDGGGVGSSWEALRARCGERRSGRAGSRDPCLWVYRTVLRGPYWWRGGCAVLLRRLLEGADELLR